MEEKKQTEIKTLKIGGYVLIDDEVYTVESVQISKPGKHGGAKARVAVSGVFIDQKKTIVKPADTKINVPIIQKRPAQVIAILGDNAQLMDMETYENFELPIPENLKEKITEGVEVIVWSFGAKRLIKGLR